MPALASTASSSMFARSSRQRKVGSSWKPIHMRSAARAETGAIGVRSAQTRTRRVRWASGKLLRRRGRVSEGTGWPCRNGPRTSNRAELSRNLYPVRTRFTWTTAAPSGAAAVASARPAAACRLPVRPRRPGRLRRLRARGTWSRRAAGRRAARSRLAVSPLAALVLGDRAQDRTSLGHDTVLLAIRERGRGLDVEDGFHSRLGPARSGLPGRSRREAKLDLASRERRSA